MKSKKIKIRFVAFLFAFIFIVSAMAIGTYAISNQPITEEEAKEILYKAFDFYNRTNCISSYSYAQEYNRIDVPKMHCPADHMRL